MRFKVIKILFIIVLILFSFFYTNRTVLWLKSIDPIMKKINHEKDKFEEKSVNALIESNTIIPGYYGKKVNVNKSYSSMKKMNKYNANYYVYEDSIPTISISNNNDKYIIKGNYLKEQVALVFKISKNNTLVEDIYSKLEDKNVIGTFFIDGVYINNNKEQIYKLVDNMHEVEILSYDNSINEESLSLTRNNLKNIINYSGTYCLLNNKNKNILELCSKNNMYTVIPTFILNSFSDLKNNLESGVIIEVNNNRILELSTIINYIKQRGYNIVSLSELLSENRTAEK